MLALIMILSLSCTAFADEGETNDPTTQNTTTQNTTTQNTTTKTYTLTINGAAGHMYDIYQVYTGDISEEPDGTYVLSNVKYGASRVPNGKEVGDSVPQDELENLINAGALNTFDHYGLGAAYVPQVRPEEDETFIKKELPPGYYLIEDISEELPEGQTKSPVIIQMVGDVTVTSKHATISSEKKVADKNDSEPSDHDDVWQDSADYDIGDSVPFQLSITLPSTLTAYTDYALTIHDFLPVGLDKPEDNNIHVYFVKNEENAVRREIAEYEYVPYCTKPETCEFGDGTDEASHACSFNITVTGIEKLYSDGVPFTKGDKIVVEYTAKLNGNANIGRTGNINAMYVCHPDGHTPIDYVTVLTYQLIVNKVDGSNLDENGKNSPLEGAEFTLYKWIDYNNEAGGTWEALNNNTAVVGNKFYWSGIDGGKYKLVETKTPTGYNTIADIEFSIDAEHLASWTIDSNSALEDLIAHGETKDIVVFRDIDDQGLEDGKLEGDIANHKGVVLPETGAQGTMMLIAVGSVLVVLAAVFMVTRKKMSIYED